MKTSALVLGLGLFFFSFNAQAYLSAPGEVNVIKPAMCLQVELTVGGDDEVVDLSEVLEANVHGACVEFLVSGTEGHSFVLLAKVPFAFVTGETLEESEPENDYRVFRKCFLNPEQEDPMNLLVFFFVDNDTLPPWAVGPMSDFQFGAYPLAEGLCE